MISALKGLLMKSCRLINYLPFNNSFRTHNTTIVNNGTLLLRCKFISKGKNTIIFRRGGSTKYRISYMRQ